MRIGLDRRLPLEPEALCHYRIRLGHVPGASDPTDALLRAQTDQMTFDLLFETTPEEPDL